MSSTPVLDTEQQPAPLPGIGIGELPVDLERGQSVAVVKLRAPGIVRAAAFWLKTPSVIGVSSGARAVDKIPMPLLFVECDPAGELRDHVFAFLPSNAPFAPRDGYRAEYRASAIQGGVGCVHVYELVKEEA